MRKLIPFAAVLLAFAGSRADEKTTAPVPKTPPPQSIEGKYLLIATVSGNPERGDRGPGFAPGGFPGGKGAKADPADAGPGGALGAPWGGPRTVRGETTITRNEIVIEGRTPFAPVPTTMEYTLDPTKTPMTIDVEINPVRGKKTKALGVVEVSGNRLTIALGKEGAERPKTTDEAEGVTVYYFMKAPPPPKVEYRIVAMRVGGEAEAEKELNTLTAAGFELVNTTSPLAPGEKSSPTTVHFILKRTVR